MSNYGYLKCFRGSLRFPDNESRLYSEETKKIILMRNYTRLIYILRIILEGLKGLTHVYNQMNLLIFFILSENNEKFLSDFGIKSQTVLKCDDFLQNYNLHVIIAHE